MKLACMLCCQVTLHIDTPTLADIRPAVSALTTLPDVQNTEIVGILVVRIIILTPPLIALALLVPVVPAAF